MIEVEDLIQRSGFYVERVAEFVVVAACLWCAGILRNKAVGNTDSWPEGSVSFELPLTRYIYSDALLNEPSISSFPRASTPMIEIAEGGIISRLLMRLRGLIELPGRN